jgi:hypothetical protein
MIEIGPESVNGNELDEYDLNYAMNLIAKLTGWKGHKTEYGS